ncbi:MAG: archaetidylserine decarboxylase [Methylococcaceae bacterium]
MSVLKILFVTVQHVLPHHWLSRLLGHLTRCRVPLIKNTLIQGFIRLYGVDLSEAECSDPEQYACFNDFFARTLKPAARPLEQRQGHIASPADGVVSQIGRCHEGQLIQAKGKNYALTHLLGGDTERALPFRDGHFATIYLSPRDYHRLHMPVDGTLREMVLIPGRLFSVNQTTSEHIPHLYGRNERVVALFDTELGPMALVLVGALFVASIETTWHGVVTPPQGQSVTVWHYADHPPVLSRGTELGRFTMGSTIIVLFGAEVMDWSESLTAGSGIRMGARLGQRRLNA